MLAVRMWPMAGSSMCGQLAASVRHGHVSGWGGGEPVFASHGVAELSSIRPIVGGYVGYH